MAKRLSRKAKIRRINKRRSKLKRRNYDVVGLINRSGGGTHAGPDPREAKAPKVDDWE